MELGEEIGREILEALRGGDGVVIELVGDVGAGKTTLTQGIAKGLGVVETITSPSFTLSKRYGFAVGVGGEAENGVLVHYDFYRLGDPGIMEEDLAEAMRLQNSVVVVEWGESIREILPEKRKTITVKYREDGGREVAIENASA